MGWAEAGNPLYGTYCADWDSLPGVYLHKDDDDCPPSKKYHEDCNHMNIPWCYVKDGCTGAKHVRSSVVMGAAYSYDMCGAPNCHKDVWDNAICPAGIGGEHDNERTCHCLFEGTTLPDHTAAWVGNPLYGTNCEEEWDEMPGTLYYDDGEKKKLFWSRGRRVYKRVQLATRTLVLCRERLYGFAR